MTYKLYLDDVRPCPENWTLARNYLEFVRIIEEDGFPSEVSFDHDLGMVYWNPNAPGGLVLANENVDERTGLHCAKYLCENDLINGSMPKDFKYYVHSANPVGAENIRCYMESYLRSKKPCPT